MQLLSPLSANPHKMVTQTDHLISDHKVYVTQKMHDLKNKGKEFQRILCLTKDDHKFFSTFYLGYLENPDSVDAGTYSADVTDLADLADLDKLLEEVDKYTTWNTTRLHIRSTNFYCLSL